MGMNKPNPYFKGVKPTRLTATEMEIIMKHWEKVKKLLGPHLSSFSIPHSKTDIDADIDIGDKKKNA